VHTTQIIFLLISSVLFHCTYYLHWSLRCNCWPRTFAAPLPCSQWSRSRVPDCCSTTRWCWPVQYCWR